MQASPRESKELSAEGFNNRKGGLKKRANLDGLISSTVGLWLFACVCECKEQELSLGSNKLVASL